MVCLLESLLWNLLILPTYVKKIIFMLKLEKPFHMNHWGILTCLTNTVDVFRNTDSHALKTDWRYAHFVNNADWGSLLGITGINVSKWY